MLVPQLVSDFFEWRWAPCVGLTLGSLGFVALALLLIPTQFDGAPASSQASSGVFDRPSSSPQRALFGASLTRESAGFTRRASEDVNPTRLEPAAAPAPAPDLSPPPQRGFSPIAEREAPPPALPAEPAPPPLPSPTNVVLAQPDGPGGPTREITSP